MRRSLPSKPDTAIHRVGQEKFVAVDVKQRGDDSPSGEPVDWLAQSDELDSYPIDEYDGYEIDDKYLWDEW